MEYRKMSYEGEPAELGAGAVSAQEKRRRLAEALKAKIHEYRIKVKLGESDVEVRFVDRDAEVEKLLGIPAAVKWGEVTVLYGPKGCGKTTFSKALAWAFGSPGFDPGYRVVLAEYEGGAVSVSMPEDLSEKLEAEGILKRIFNTAEVSVGVGIAPFFLTVSTRVGEKGRQNPHVDAVRWLLEQFASSIANRPVEGVREYIFVVDEYKVSSVEEARVFIDTIPNTLSRLNQGLYQRLGRSAPEISLVITTSDAVAAKLTGPIGGKVGWLYMWNLPREASEDYAGQIGLFERASGELGLGMEKTRELLWRLAGGNPRNLRIMTEKGVMPWLSSIIAEVADTINVLEGRIGNRLWSALGEVLERVDTISKYEDLRDIFLSENMVIRFVGAEPISPLPSEPWVGRAYAFQIPAYYYAVRAIHKKRSLEISPRDVLDETMKG